MSKLTEQKYLDAQGQLGQWPSNQKEKLLVLSYLAGKFDESATYTEPQVNDLLKQWHTFSDWPLLRRELVERGFLDRTRDGSQYHLHTLPTDNPDVRLLRPNVERDATVAAGWLEGPEGRDTLRLMGNTEANNQPSSPEREAERIRGFITASSQRTWAIRSKDQTVGVIWVNFEPTEHLSAPSVHLMLGDRASRGQGIGTAALQAVLGVMSADYQYVYSRHITSNTASARLLAKTGFTNDGQPYTDQDGLTWQNVKLHLHQPE